VATPTPLGARALVVISGLELGVVDRRRIGLDHFLVCNFKIYTQVYHHPVAEAFALEFVKLIRSEGVHTKLKQKCNFSWHREANDYSFRMDIADAGGSDIERKFFLRGFRGQKNDKPVVLDGLQYDDICRYEKQGYEVHRISRKLIAPLRLSQQAHFSRSNLDQRARNEVDDHCPQRPNWPIFRRSQLAGFEVIAEARFHAATRSSRIRDRPCAPPCTASSRALLRLAVSA
jgi:hypothetical protein